jgi:hypothetical protein
MTGLNTIGRSLLHDANMLESASSKSQRTSSGAGWLKTIGSIQPLGTVPAMVHQL